MKRFYKRKKVSPYVKILISFATVILIGTLLLWLPFSSASGKAMPFIDAFFLSTSSVCITGLSTVPNLGESLSTFGKTVIAFLMEIGGLSILTIAIFILVLLRKKVGIGERFMLKEALNLESMGGVVRMLKAIIFFALSVQLLGVILLLPFLAMHYDFLSALGLSFFHSVASFNNAGFDVFGYADSLNCFRHDYYFMTVTMLLIIIGGLGFIVIFDIADFMRRKRRLPSLLTKIVLVSTLGLIILGAVFIYVGNTEIGFFDALFYSVSSRTAGFATVPVNDLSGLANTSLIILMFIGGAPCSTAGGLKTSSAFVICLSTFAFALGKKPKIFHRRISRESITKSFSLFSIFVLFVIMAVVLIELFEPALAFDDILFEVVSALSNTGLSRGITTLIGTGAKLVLIVTMFLGRTGPLTIFNLWSYKHNEDEDINYVEEKIITG